jgi:predicted outer membrane lipoprotein
MRCVVAAKAFLPCLASRRPRFHIHTMIVRLTRYALGVSLLAAAYAPLHTFLDPARTGPAGAATREAADITWTLGLSGTLIVVAFSWVVVRMSPRRETGGLPAAVWARLERRILSPSPGVFFGLVGAVTLVLAAIVAVVIYGGAPTSVDGMVQLLHAQALASGELALPLEGGGASWVVQNGVVTDLGWVSIYPPSHTLLLAAGVVLGAPSLVGPISTGVATAMTSATVERLLGALEGRVLALLLMVSPFWLLVGSTHLSHSTAAAGLAATLFCSVRARDGHLGWSFATGAAVGLAVSTRPWTGLACSSAILLALWLPDVTARSRGRLARRMGALLLGGAPFAVLLLWWNNTLFGDPTRLGYTAAFGPTHGLGWHRDPWGNEYGALEALGYTGADLSLLGIRLLESPLPIVAIVGMLLLTGPVHRNAWVFLMWVASAVGANALYWHHGMHFGPRMLFESVPAWLALFSVAFSTAWRSPVASTQGRVARWTLGLTIAGGLAFAPFAFLAAGSGPRVVVPDVEGGSAIVFVHGSWASRLGARLSVAGMRRDSIETALRRNDICAVDRYVRWRTSDRDGPPPALDFRALPGTPLSLQTQVLSPGNLVRTSPTREADATCAREAQSDRFGVLDLEMIAWQSPPLDDRAVIFARDLGPTGNLPTLEATDRTPWIYIDVGADRTPLLLGYSEGMEVLWRGAAGESTRD